MNWLFKINDNVFVFIELYTEVRKKPCVIN